MNNRIKELFARYQSGNATPEEVKLIEEWFAAFDADQEHILNNTTRHVFKDDRLQQIFNVNPKVRRISRAWLQAAAILLAGLLSFLYRAVNRPPGEKPLTYTHISAPFGSKKQCQLPDGTTVFLNAGSSITIASVYNAKERRVELTGEAYFLVKHDAKKTFSVHTGKLMIADIGTSFNVKAYPDEAQISVAVETGSVSVKSNVAGSGTRTYAEALTPNQQFTFNKQTGRHTLGHVAVEDVTGWRENKLQFDNASFNDIAISLERWYNVSVNLDNDKGLHKRYTVSFNNEPLNNVLKVLSNLTGMTYQIRNNIISINLKNCK